MHMPIWPLWLPATSSTTSCKKKTENSKVHRLGRARATATAPRSSARPRTPRTARGNAQHIESEQRSEKYPGCSQAGHRGRRSHQMVRGDKGRRGGPGLGGGEDMRVTPDKILTVTLDNCVTCNPGRFLCNLGLLNLTLFIYTWIVTLAIRMLPLRNPRPYAPPPIRTAQEEDVKGRRQLTCVKIAKRGRKEATASKSG